MNPSSPPDLSYFGAACQSWGELRDALLQGADPDDRAHSDETPLHFCAERGHNELLRLLLEAGADANARDEWGCTPLFSTAILSLDTTTARQLLRAGTDPNTQGIGGETALYRAAKAGAEVLAHCLLEWGADPMAATDRGERPLDVAEGVYLRWLLLAAGAEAPEDFPPLPGRLFSSHAKPGGRDLSLLLEAMKDDELQYLWGCTPLHLAALSGNAEALNLLLHAGHAPSAPDADGRTALDWAVTSGKLEAVALLLGAGAEVSGDMLLRAVEQETPTLLRLLLPASSSPDLLGEDPTEHPACAPRITALHRAAELGNAGMLRLLLAAGADINAQDTQQQTALHRAVRRHNMPAVLLLLEWGASPHAADEDGQTPLHLAGNMGDARLLKLLQEQGTEPPLPGNEETEQDMLSDRSYETLAEAAAWGDTQEVLYRLREDHEDPNARDSHGRTALHRAIELNKVNTARCLLQHGADALATDAQGHSALDGALSHAMRCLLRRHGARLRHEHPQPT